MAMSTLLSAKNLCIGYHSNGGNIQIHQNLNFSLRRGELISLCGPNGAGKSTLLRTIANLQPPLSGEIEVLEKPMKSYSEKELSRAITVVLTDRAHTGGLTVKEVVALGRQPYTGFFGRLSQEDKTLVNSAVESVGMTGKEEVYMSELSDGERQKVMIAKSLVQECPIVILDEPTAFLDVASRIEITQLLHDIAHQQDRAVLLSTHDLEQALRLSDQLWLLTKNGLQTGTPEDLVSNHQIDTLFEGRNVFFDDKTWTFRSKTRILPCT